MKTIENTGNYQLPGFYETKGPEKGPQVKITPLLTFLFSDYYSGDLV